MGTLASRLGRDAEWPVLRCADGHVALVYQPADWAALCRLCADARLDDPRFAEPGARRLHTGALADIVEAALGHLTRQQLQDRAMALRLPLGPVWTIDDLRSDPQVLARDFLTQAHGIPRLPVLWNSAALPVGAPPGPAMGDGA
jgi:crotonobetainyl-CoA:carnitine CoA-transferase CaiB-like acyl-CoA transferase